MARGFDSHLASSLSTETRRVHLRRGLCPVLLRALLAAMTTGQTNTVSFQTILEQIDRIQETALTIKKQRDELVALTARALDVFQRHAARRITDPEAISELYLIFDALMVAKDQK